MTAASHNESPLLPKSVVEAARQRVKRLQQAMQKAGVEALLISAEKDIQYLTGFVGHESLAMVTANGGVIVSDSRYDEYLQPWRDAKASDVVMGIRHRLYDSVRDICDQLKIKRLGVQADQITVAGRASVAAKVGDSRLVDTNALVSSLRMKKDASEIAMIEKAIDVAQQALTAALDRLEPGMSENQFAATLEYEMKWRGANGAGFTPIIGSGSNSSIIHHSTGPTIIRDGVLLVDWGCIVDGYNSDLTRTFGIGQMPAKLREAYRIVLDAQLAAIAAIRPGRMCSEIDAVARKVITDAGLGDYFGHGLGHGLGMDVHEGPYFNSLSTDVPVEPGLVMTVEPGAYIPGVGGVRVEDDVVVTETGCRVLSSYPKDPDSCIIDARLTAGAHEDRRGNMIDIRKLKELVRLMVDNDLTELDLRDSEEQVTMRRSGPGVMPTVLHAPAPAMHAGAPIMHTGAAMAPTHAVPTSGASGGAHAATSAEAAEEAGLKRIESPMVGTFYAQANPDSPPFVTVGAGVSPDKTVCIIEAMKIFNEIKAEISGTIVKLLVKSGEPVEFGQALFLVKPG